MFVSHEYVTNFLIEFGYSVDILKTYQAQQTYKTVHGNARPNLFMKI